MILNDTDLQGHKLRLKADFSPQPVVIDIILDGDVTTGHTFQIDTPQSVSFTTPLTTVFNFSALVEGVPLFTPPTLAGEYTFEVEFHLGAEVITRTFAVNKPAITPSGSDVTNEFIGGTSITFDRVLGQGGMTTISSSATPPPEGTGQFQPSGGLYYDFNTTANIKCPCTVTLPYDSQTPDPRIYHLEDGVWVDATISVDTVNHRVTGVVSSLSFFTVGTANFNVDWAQFLDLIMARFGNPFPVRQNGFLALGFRLENSEGQTVSPADVSVEIWQTKDENGDAITPIKTLTQAPTFFERLQSYGTLTRLSETSFALGTYEARVLVSNTTATQDPSILLFTIIERSNSQWWNAMGGASGQDLFLQDQN